jgi:O-antigen/teichoic acid export membrane protein
MDQQISNLKNRTISGVRWSAIAKLFQQILSFFTIAILAHLLSPSAFGLIGMVLIVTNFVEIFKDLGTFTAIIQRKEISQELISSVFWTNLFLGVLFTFIIILIAPFTATFFHEPEISLIMKIISISFILSGLSVVPQALLVREMLFRRLAFIENVSLFLGAIVGVGMALMNGGVWSLVVQSLVRVFSMGIMLWVLSPVIPQLNFSLNSLKPIVSYSLNLSGFNLLNYIIRNADNMLIGRYLGATSLGFYSLAYKWMLLPVYYISGVLGQVFLPAFSKLQNENSKFCAVYLRLCSSIGIVTFPLLLGMVGLAKPFIFVTLGHQWTSIVPLIIILSPVGILQSVGTTAGYIYLAKGRTDLMLLWGCIGGFLYLLSFIIGLKWGVIGVSLAYAISNGILFYPSLLIPFRLIELKISKFLEVMWPILRSGLLMFAIMKGLIVALEWAGITDSWVLLIIGILVGATSYILMVLKFQKSELRDILSLVPMDSLWGTYLKSNKNTMNCEFVKNG